MRKFNVVVDGKTYQVEVDEILSGDVPQTLPPVTAVTLPAIAPVQSKPATPVAPKVAVVADGVKLNAPLPGTILSFKVQTGATVKKGQVVLVIEAMKMENDIASPADGVITFTVSQGESVQQNQLLASVK